MGLDMYLTRRTYVKNWSHMKPDELHEVIVKKNNQKHPYIDPDKITEIIEEVGYWRKANMIHNWFVENVQQGKDDCLDHYVSVQDLKNLLQICEEVYALKDLPEDKREKEAGKKLPTVSGFFFGQVQYDEYYFDDIERTIGMLKPLIELDNELKKADATFMDIPAYFYTSSW